MATRVVSGILGAAALALVSGCMAASPPERAAAPVASGGSPTQSPAAAAPATQAPAQPIDVRLGDYFFEPAALSVRPGPVVLNLINTSEQRRHTFVVKDLSGQGNLFDSDSVQAGESRRVEFTLTQAGRYEVFCRVSDHAERGQVGTLVVQAG